jgi:hypothetical protein
MARLLEDIKNAIGTGRLAKLFAQHVKGNPWGYPEYFELHPDGQYSLVEESTKPVGTS